MATVTANQFARALTNLGELGGNQIAFLKAHYEAPGRASTTTNLALAAGYKDYHAINLHYGTLADRLGNELGVHGQGLGLICEWAKPDTISNEHYILVMRPEFAEGLRQAHWV